MDSPEAKIKSIFIYVPIVMLIIRFFIPFIYTAISNGLIKLSFFIYDTIFIYIYPMLAMVILIHKKKLDGRELRLRIELYAGLAARILIINDFLLMISLLIGGESLYRFVRDLLGMRFYSFMSIILPNYFTGLGPTAYFEYASPYLGSFYELLSGEEYFMYWNYKWITPLLITTTYIFLTSLLLIGILFKRHEKKVIIFFYSIALLNSLFPFLLPLIQYLLYGPVIDYHHFGAMALAIYVFFQFAYLPYNIGRLAELIGYDKLIKAFI